MRTTLLIALPKGRLFDAAIDLLRRAGVDTDGGQGSRKLTFTDKDGQYEFVALKPADVPVYVESGAVDAGIVGSDVLRELDCDVNEPLDLRIGLCRLAVAARRRIGPRRRSTICASRRSTRVPRPVSSPHAIGIRISSGWKVPWRSHRSSDSPMRSWILWRPAAR